MAIRATRKFKISFHSFLARKTLKSIWNPIMFETMGMTFSDRKKTWRRIQSRKEEKKNNKHFSTWAGGKAVGGGAQVIRLIWKCSEWTWPYTLRGSLMFAFVSSRWWGETKITDSSLGCLLSLAPFVFGPSLCVTHPSSHFHLGINESTRIQGYNERVWVEADLVFNQNPNGRYVFVFRVTRRQVLHAGISAPVSTHQAHFLRIKDSPSQ